MKRQIIYSFSITFLFLAGLYIALDTRGKSEKIKWTRIMMGTVVDIQIRDNDKEKAEAALLKAFEEISRIDTLFTVSDRGPVEEINGRRDSVVTVDEEIFRLITLCDSLWHLSGGSFDASIGSLIKTWGFNQRSPHLPSEQNIQTALSASGWGKLKLLKNNKILFKKHIQFDFNAVAKGYAVDRAVSVLKKAGIKEALVNAGGEIKCIGSGWKIGIQHPRHPGEIIEEIKLKDFSAATSGDYENYFEENNVRYHHLLNPRNGYPAEGIQSVTVLHADNRFADGLATALFVLGKKKGIELAEKLSGTEAMIIDSEGECSFTSGFKKYIIN